MVSIDASEVRAFAALLDNKAHRAASEFRPVVERGALNVKNDLQAQLRTSRTFARVAPAVSYDMKGFAGFGSDLIEAEIGPVKGSPGSLANIAYFGTYKGGGTVEDPQMALDREAPNFADWIARVAADL